jgi:hypothetical protein
MTSIDNVEFTVSVPIIYDSEEEKAAKYGSRSHFTPRNAWGIWWTVRHARHPKRRSMSGFEKVGSFKAEDLLAHFRHNHPTKEEAK